MKHTSWHFSFDPKHEMLNKSDGDIVKPPVPFLAVTPKNSNRFLVNISQLKKILLHNMLKDSFNDI